MTSLPEMASPPPIMMSVAGTSPTMPVEHTPYHDDGDKPCCLRSDASASATPPTPPPTATFVSRVPLFPQDSDRVKAIKTGLNAYFAAVSLQGVSREEKLKAIQDTFSRQTNTELITPSGLILRGNDQVVSFYASEESPVMKDPNFCPQVSLATICVSADGNTIAVEIALTESINVGDWFSFDDEAKILRLRIY
jgi:hypothetical protein